MALTQGSRLGPYEIIAPLGAGGMGEVYRARDTKLDRDVAIKVLPAAFAEDAARMARFEREAQMLAALNHPNIAAIYGIEQGALVMELVEGEDLKGPLPVETALNYARQIATALEAAHEKGIIHRDLKPANIKVTPDGVVKLLDFGLAKAAEETCLDGGRTSADHVADALAADDAGGNDPGHGGLHVARAGARQAGGQARRHLGVRRGALRDAHRVACCSAAARPSPTPSRRWSPGEPDWKALPTDTPPRIRRLLERCLRKDPKQRLRDIGDARLILDEAEPEPMPQQRRAWLPWAVAGLALVLAAVAGTAWFRSEDAGHWSGRARFLLTLPEGTSEPNSPAAPQTVPSPDGRYLAFIARDASRGRTTCGFARWVRCWPAGWIRPRGRISRSGRRMRSSSRSSRTTN